jgi:hypothetical protein
MNEMRVSTGPLIWWKFAAPSFLRGSVAFSSSVASAQSHVDWGLNHITVDLRVFWFWFGLVWFLFFIFILK